MSRVSQIGMLCVLMQFPLHGQSVSEIVQWIQEGRIAEAQTGLNTLEASSKQNDSILFLKGLIARDADEAAVHYQKLIKTYPESDYSGKAMLRLAQLKYAQGLYRSSLILFGGITDHDKKSALLQESHYWAGLCYLAMNQTDSAVIEFSRVISEFPVRETSRLAAEELRSLKVAAPALSGPDTRLSSGSVTATGSGSHRTAIQETAATVPTRVSGRFTLQAGAFSDQNNAMARMQFYENKGYTVRLTNKTINNTQLYLVWIGAFDQEAEARAFAEELQQKYGSKTTLVTIP